LIPHLKKQGTATQLIVHEKPFLVLGGELGNSSASDPAYMETIWSKVVWNPTGHLTYTATGRHHFSHTARFMQAFTQSLDTPPRMW
jgi:hypothetical protein